MSTRSAQAARRAIAKAGGLVTPQEIAAEWGVSKQVVSKWITAGRFPEPIKVAGRVRLYLRDEVEPLRPRR